MPRTKKDFEAARLGVFAAPGSLLTRLNCGNSVQSFIVKKDVRSPRELKRKKIAGSTPGGTATLMADLAPKHHFGFDPGRDVTISRSEETG